MAEAGPIIKILEELTSIMGREVLFHEMGDPQKLKDEVMGPNKGKTRLIVISEKVSMSDRM